MEEQYCGVPKSYLNFYAAFRNAEAAEEGYFADDEYTFPDGMCFPVDVLDQALDMMLEHAAGDMSKW
ncbi:MAG: hypothetical protein VW333_03600 [Pseudomonadales bacterium]